MVGRLRPRPEDECSLLTLHQPVLDLADDLGAAIQQDDIASGAAHIDWNDAGDETCQLGVDGRLQGAGHNRALGHHHVRIFDDAGGGTAEGGGLKQPGQVGLRRVGSGCGCSYGCASVRIGIAGHWNAEAACTNPRPVRHAAAGIGQDRRRRCVGLGGVQGGRRSRQWQGIAGWRLVGWRRGVFQAGPAGGYRRLFRRRRVLAQQEVEPDKAQRHHADQGNQTQLLSGVEFASLRPRNIRAAVFNRRTVFAHGVTSALTWRCTSGLTVPVAGFFPMVS